MSGDDEWDNCCPLCINPFTEQDKQFRPCKCSFRLCVWCWHTIVTMAQSEYQSGTCPQCRTPYDMEQIRRQQVTVVGKKKNPRRAAPARAHLADVVVNDKRVVAVRNIPALLVDVDPTTGAHEVLPPEQRVEALSQHFLFGQYGRIVGGVVMPAENGRGMLYHAALRFSSSEESARCIRAVHGSKLLGHTIRCALIPSRYCSQFLLKCMCSKKMCVDLHNENTDKALIQKHLSAASLPVLGLAAELFQDGEDRGEQTELLAESRLLAIGNRVRQLTDSWIDSVLQQSLMLGSGTDGGSTLLTPLTSANDGSEVRADSFSSPISEPVSTARLPVNGGAAVPRVSRAEVTAAVAAVESLKRTSHRLEKLQSSCTAGSATPAPTCTLGRICELVVAEVPASQVELALPLPSLTAKRR